MAELLTDSKMVAVLDSVYEKVLDGVPKVSQPVSQLADDYLAKHSSVEKAARSFINYQIAKCTTSGFVTNLGGLITLPVAIPANVGSVLYIQLRMVAALSHMGGFDLNSDQVQTMCYVCLVGNAAADLLKQSAIKIGEKAADAAIKKIPATVLRSINKKVGFRLITKTGQKGALVLTKLLPVVGGIVGGGMDLASTKIIADNAYKMFIKKQDL